MKKSTSIALIVLVQALLLAVGAFAALTVSPPHYDETSGFVCTTCHTTHLSLGSTGYNNTCQSCHRPGDPAAGAKPITPADAANPFGIHSTTGISKMYQTSHRWDGSDTNAAAGARPPVQAQMTTSNLRARTQGQLACVRCHNQHSNANGNFLRMANDQDQLCLDCHSSRNTPDHTKGTHPVGVVYPANTTSFNPSPVNSNPANPTSALNLLGGTTVSCSTCHGVHGTDSRSGTLDGSANFANLSSGDGNLLRTDLRGAKVTAGTTDNLNLCTNCHAGKTNHNKNDQNVQCTDCHGAHVEFDAAAVGTETTPNVYLVRRYLQYTSANRISKRIIYNSTATKNFYNPNGGGVCQSCHNPPDNHFIATTTTIEPGHASCATCHTHNEAKGSFSVGACGTCHLTGTSTPALATGSHTVHFASISGNDPLFVCAKCHIFTGDTGSTHADGTVNLSNGCSACHGQGSPTWGATYVAPGATFPYSTNQCDKCHSGSAATAPFYSTATPNKVTVSSDPKVGAHTAHLTAAHSLTGALACADCHGTVVTVTAANHMNGTTDFAFSPLAKTGGLNPTYNAANGQCANVYCHGASLAGGTGTIPGWTQTLTGCASCHGFPPATLQNGGTHPNSTTCNSCHTHVNATNNGFTIPALHINGQTDVAAGSCDSCHGYPPVPSGFVIPQGNWTNAKIQDYPGGGGAHIVAAHISPNANASEGWTNCTMCHNSGNTGSTPNHKMTLPISSNISNVTVAVDPKLRFADSFIIYTSAKLVNPPALNVTGSCSNISCHMSPSPRWSTER